MATVLKSIRTLSRHGIMFLFILLVFACKKDKPADSLTVQGNISNIDPSASAASITLKNSSNSYECLASASGSFTIANVVAGDYDLKISQEKSGGHVEKNLKASVWDQNIYITVKLPDPVVLSSPSHTQYTVTLTWTRSYDEGFREYKVYRGLTPGLDETTGTLINVLTISSDTLMTDGQEMNINGGVAPGTKYYYRVMVMDQYGKIAGSNLINVTTDSLPSVPEMYKLEAVTNFPGNTGLGLIRGIAYDGNFIWMAYSLSPGGYYDSVNVTLVKYDYQNNQTLKTLRFKDIYPEFGGLDFDGTNLWLQVTKPGNMHMLIKIDTATGGFLGTYPTDYGVRDVSAYNDVIYLNYYYEKIELINPDNGALLNTLHYSIFPGTNSHGMLVRENEIWLTFFLVNNGMIHILDHSASLIGYVKTPVNDVKPCFIGNQLFLYDNTRVYIYNVQPLK